MIQYEVHQQPEAHILRTDLCTHKADFPWEGKNCEFTDKEYSGKQLIPSKTFSSGKLSTIAESKSVKANSVGALITTQEHQKKGRQWRRQSMALRIPAITCWLKIPEKTDKTLSPATTWSYPNIYSLYIFKSQKQTQKTKNVSMYRYLVNTICQFITVHSCCSYTWSCVCVCMRVCV